MRVPVDLFANIGFDARQPPPKWRAKLTHACLRDAVGEKDDTILAFYFEAGIADDPVAPAFGQYFSLLNARLAFWPDE